MARVIVYSRQGCHLCEEALAVVSAVCEEWTVVDIDADEALRARYSDDVPVVTVDGRVIARWFVEKETLRRAL